MPQLREQELRERKKQAPEAEIKARHYRELQETYEGMDGPSLLQNLDQVQTTLQQSESVPKQNALRREEEIILEKYDDIMHEIYMHIYDEYEDMRDISQLKQKLKNTKKRQKKHINLSRTMNKYNWQFENDKLTEETKSDK